ncbi:DegT/DnrJ/EryC1/StrS family aminotransferase [Paenibacillus sp. sgz5001063]|uniref:DegT/DnrJ/EryC1/StrS family aminotransferase n=1 Tax=Paenibacillus sp. sgz5001063 TaxID=3242474 RepID=UPI0036D3E3A2
MIYVSKPHLPNQEKFISYVARIYRSGILTNHGQLVTELEGRLAEYLGVENILLVTNGTIALNVAYKLLELKGEVITTPFSFVATTSSLVWEGLQPIFADIDESTLNMNIKEIENKITDSTSAIVPVHVFGNGCQVEEIDAIAKANNLKVIYDAAHAFGVQYNGQSILNYGDVATLSFHATKIFHTIEGGALIIKDKELYRRAKKMIDFGIDGPDKIVAVGINAKMNEFQAAMGLCVLDDMDELLNKRKGLYENYAKAFEMDSPRITLQKHNEKCTNNYSYFPIVLEDEISMMRVRELLMDEGITPRRYFYPSLDSLDYVESEHMPVSGSITKRILCLPLYDSLAFEDQKRIIQTVKEALL